MKNLIAKLTLVLSLAAPVAASAAVHGGAHARSAPGVLEATLSDGGMAGDAEARAPKGGCGHCGGAAAQVVTEWAPTDGSAPADRAASVAPAACAAPLARADAAQALSDGDVATDLAAREAIAACGPALHHG